LAAGLLLSTTNLIEMFKL